MPRNSLSVIIAAPQRSLVVLPWLFLDCPYIVKDTIKENAFRARVACSKKRKKENLIESERAQLSEAALETLGSCVNLTHIKFEKVKYYDIPLLNQYTLPYFLIESGVRVTSATLTFRACYRHSGSQRPY